jgi:hypothetical protein
MLDSVYQRTQARWGSRLRYLSPARIGYFCQKQSRFLDITTSPGTKILWQNQSDPLCKVVVPLWMLSQNHSGPFSSFVTMRNIKTGNFPALEPGLRPKI